MTDLTKLLREADPALDDEGLTPVQAQAIRREIVAVVSKFVYVFPIWQRPLAIAAVVALVVAVGGIAGRRMTEPEAARATSTQSDSSEVLVGGSSVGHQRRQLQFATPGGTRIIWIFDQNLRLQESMP